MIPVKDFVDLMTDQHLRPQTDRGLWRLGESLYLSIGSKSRYSFKNEPYFDGKEVKSSGRNTPTTD